MSFRLLEKIGKGSYGNVYTCKFDNDQVYAVKVLPFKEGVPSLVEANILSMFIHPHIMNSTEIYTIDDNLYLIQELAVQDMETFLKNNEVPREPTIKKWFFQALSAISCLHNNNIIHCDIKPNNIVLDTNNNLKLIDFTFSVIKTNSNQTFKKTVGCKTYSPPEILSKSKWSNPIDIWSLGCTFYEICTGSYLIPSQGERNESDNQLNSKTLSCIYQWRKSLGDDVTGYISLFTHKKSIVISPIWADINKNLKEIILLMTSYKAIKRPTADMVLNFPYFSEFQRIEYSIKKNIESNSVKSSDINLINNFFDQIEFYDKDVKDLTKSIYLRIEPFDKNIFKINTSFWIAHKLLRDGKAPRKIFYQKKEIIKYEEEICSYLDYILYTV